MCAIIQVTLKWWPDARWVERYYAFGGFSSPCPTRGTENIKSGWEGHPHLHRRGDEQIKASGVGAWVVR